MYKTNTVMLLMLPVKLDGWRNQRIKQEMGKGRYRWRITIRKQVGSFQGIRQLAGTKITETQSGGIRTLPSEP